MRVFETSKKEVRASGFLPEEACLQDDLGNVEEIFGLQGESHAFVIDGHPFLLQHLQPLQSLS